ncbi:MAG: hypothetical protein AAF434_02260 [Pseudomonadota bacterium]
MERILFCPGNRMIAYDWSNGKFGGVKRFSASDDGYREFELYLQNSLYRPIHIVVDLIEEEFHTDSVPYAWGSDRVAVLQRSMRKFFRTSELRSLQVQGRHKTGRRDLEVLVSGLGNATILRKWLDILQRARVPVKGIYSLPLIGQDLLSTLKMDKRRVLLVSQQSPMTLRQSFYDNGKLKLSRLSLHRMAREDSLSDVNYVRNDVNNTLLYLRSQRLLRRNESLDVCVIVNDGVFPDFANGLRGEELVDFSVYRHSEIAKRVGIKKELPTDFTDGVFAHVLLDKSKLSNHYGPRDLTRFYRYHNVRKWLLVAAGLVLLLSSAYVVSRYYEVQLLHRYARDARIHKKLYRKHYNERVGQSEAYKLEPDTLKSAVGTVHKLEEYSEVSPLPLLGELAKILQRNGNVELTRINWLRYPDPDIAINNNTVRPRSSIRQEIDSTDDHYQVVSIEGEMTNYGENFRSAVELFDFFVAELEGTGKFSFVNVVKTPFDIDSDTGLEGDSGTSARTNIQSRSTFELRATLVRESEQES